MSPTSSSTSEPHPSPREIASSRSLSLLPKPHELNLPPPSLPFPLHPQISPVAMSVSPTPSMSPLVTPNSFVESKSVALNRDPHLNKGESKARAHTSKSKSAAVWLTSFTLFPASSPTDLGFSPEDRVNLGLKGLLPKSVQLPRPRLPAESRTS